MSERRKSGPKSMQPWPGLPLHIWLDYDAEGQAHYLTLGYPLPEGKVAYHGYRLTEIPHVGAEDWDKGGGRNVTITLLAKEFTESYDRWKGSQHDAITFARVRQFGHRRRPVRRPKEAPDAG